MHESLFAHAATPPPAVVLHLPLKPYSISHEIELWRQNNPLLTGTRAEFDALPAAQQAYWLILAADYCSQTHAEFKTSAEILESTPAWWQFAARAKKRRLLRVWSRWQAITGQLTEPQIAAAATAFREYLMLGRSFPPAPTETGAKYGSGRPEETGGRLLGSPVITRLINFLASHTELVKDLLPAGHSILDFPFGLAVWLYLTQAEMDGNGAIENADEAAAEATEQQLLAEIAAEQAAAQQNTAATPCPT